MLTQFMSTHFIHSGRQEGSSGTWIDKESMAYPKGSLRQSRRFGQVLFPDGKTRRVKLSIPDTYFTIPATCRVGKATVSGFVSVDNDGAFRFTGRGKNASLARWES